MLSKNISYIIIQAGGKGKRLDQVTTNKPKALVSLHGKPNIFHLMSQFKHAHFIIIGDYKKDVFKKYLKKFCTFKYTFIEADGVGTVSGIKRSLRYIPKQTYFAIIWCDLYVTGQFLPSKIDTKNNYIGLSNNLFKCRWSFLSGVFEKKSSYKRGIAGVYLFKEKNELINLPENGEFCKFLHDQKTTMISTPLKNIYEFGNTNLYKKLVSSFANSRPFNRIIFKDKTIIKIPTDKQGEELAVLESAWYKKISSLHLRYIPKMFHVKPLEIQRIDGVSLYKHKSGKKTKKTILREIIQNLKELHNLYNTIPANTSNDYEALLGKTKKRLDLIAALIPDIKKDTFLINGQECINFYKKWSLVENLVVKYFGSKYVFIHGDPTFSNTMINKKNKILFIDPRGYYGKVKLFGDEDYDWSKLYYSFVGNYDQLNSKNFSITMDKGVIVLKIRSNGWEFLEKDFFITTGRPPEKIKTYHAILWLSLTSYIWDDYDAICAAFYNGMRLMQEVYAKAS